MRITQKGKIGRLPRAVREQLNMRLQDGQSGPAIVPWLNELPEVKEMLAREFEGNAITEQNLSDWRNSGYTQWVRLQNAAGELELWEEMTTDLDQTMDKEKMWSGICLLMTVQLGALYQKSLGEELPTAERWGYLKESVKMLTDLRKTEVFFDKRRREKQQETKTPPLKKEPTQAELEQEWERVEKSGVSDRKKPSTLAKSAPAPVAKERVAGAAVVTEEQPEWSGDMLQHPDLQPFRELAWARVPAIKTMTEAQLREHICNCLTSPQWSARNVKVMGKEFMRRVIGIMV